MKIRICLSAAAAWAVLFCNAVSAELQLSEVPKYTGEPYVEVNGNLPYFEPDEVTVEAYENYSPLDYLGRCGVAEANICIEIMPSGKRGDIQSVKPAGWHSVSYDFIPGKSLYNRSHLIGYQLAGENANKENLITGTRYLNATGMLPFENAVADYVEDNNAHVMYRVTPLYDGNNLIASGVEMEAYSVEDAGEGICFNVYCYNVQPGVSINYTTGESFADGSITEPQKEILPDVSKSLHGDNKLKESNSSTDKKNIFQIIFEFILMLLRWLF